MFLHIRKQRLLRQQNKTAEQQNDKTSFIERDKLRLMNTNCANAATTWTQHDNLALLTLQSDWCTETVPHFNTSKVSDCQPFG